MIRRCPRLGRYKAPIVDRHSVGAAVVALVLCAEGGAFAAGTLTEDEAVRVGLSAGAVAEVVEGGIQLAEGERERARRWPNPVLSYQREETATGAGTTEQYGWVSQTFDVAGRRSTRGSAAEHRVRAAEAEGDAFRILRGTEIRQRFYATLHEQLRVAALVEWVAQGDRIAAIIARRKLAGDVSGYDAMRIEREQATARARLATAEASSIREREALAGLLGSAGGWDAVSGDLLSAEPIPSLDALLERIDGRPDVRALDEATQAAQLDARAAGRWWAPDVTMGAGIKNVDDTNDRFSGPFLSASIPLPVLDQDQAARLEAAGRERESRGRRTLLAATARAELTGLREEASRLQAAAVEFRRSTLPDSRGLISTAERAYEAGEMDLLALLDAHRSALEAELQALDLESGARRARIELDRVAGVVP